MFGPWWVYLLALWGGTMAGWLLCSVMIAAHRADIATGDEPDEIRPLMTRRPVFSRN